MKTVFIGINSKYIHTALGPRYIVEYCKEQGFWAELLEVSVNEPILSVLTRITEFVEKMRGNAAALTAEPVLIGMEVHIWNRRYVTELCELVKKVLPHCRIMLGGPEVLFHPEQTLSQIPAADYVVCGEGEEIVARYLQYEDEKEKQPADGMAEKRAAAGGVERNIDRAAVKTGVVQEAEDGAIAQYDMHDELSQKSFLQERRQGKLPEGLACRSKNGNVVATSPPVVVEDMDRLPFPYPDLEQVVRQHKIVYYEASRGCPFHCAYCLSGISRSVRRRSLPLVLADMDRIVAAGAKLIKFVDRTYNLDENYYLPMMQYLAEMETDATFHFEIKADMLSPQAVEFLKTVPKGRFQLEIGVQSTNQDVLTAIGRKDNWIRLQHNVEELLAAGNMHIHMDLIAGLPLEDLASFRRSFNDVYALRPQALQLGFLKVLPGTVMDREQERHGVVHMAEPPYEVLATRYISYKEIRFLKIMEEVFDLTANSGRFPFTLNYLIQQLNETGMTRTSEEWGKEANGAGARNANKERTMRADAFADNEKTGEDAFLFFADLTEWYREKGLFGLGHNSTEVAEMLFSYVKERHSGLLFAVRELLRLDVLMNLPNFKPEWLGWRDKINYERSSRFWRKEEMVRQYVPEYTFKNWRVLHRQYALEEFLFDPWERSKKSVFILVNYNETGLTRIETNAII